MNPSINFQLLDEIIDHIEKHPETWNQQAWRCETGMCVAGWAVDMSEEFQWLNPENPDDDSVLQIHPDGGEMAYGDPHEPARQILGLTDMQAGELFAWANELKDIKAYRHIFEEDQKKSREFIPEG